MSRYTDKHVINNPELIEVAKNYVTYYDGSFPFIDECRERLAIGHSLNTAQVRAVLNTMLADPTVIHLPKPKTLLKDYSQDEPKNNRPHKVELPTKWRKDYGMSTNPRAEKVHKLDKDKSTITYYPRLYHKKFERRFVVQLRWSCGGEIASQHNSYVNTKLMTYFEAKEVIFTSNHRRWCPQCEQL